MKIIIVGCGKVGSSLVDQLSKEKHEITIVDRNADVVSDISNTYDVMGVVGNGASYELLQETGIEEANLLIAVTDSDEVNMLACLVAKKVGGSNNPDFATIARVRNPLYSKEVAYIKEELGLATTINPEYAAAMEISRLIRFPSASKVDTFAKGKVELVKMEIPENSPLNGLSLIDIGKKYSMPVLIGIVERGEEVVIPRGNFVLMPGDRISLIATPEIARHFFHKVGLAVKGAKNVMIIGGGTIAIYLAEELLKSGITVKIVDWNREKCEELSDRMPEAAIICGDASNQDVLFEEGIRTVDGFVSLTGIDETNIFLSLFAKRVSKAKVITKVNRISFDDIIEEFNPGSIIYPKSITADYIVRYVRAKSNSIGSNVETLYRLMDGRVETLEFSIRKNSPVAGIPLMELKLKKDVLIACINHRGRIEIPNGRSVIHEGDTVVIITTTSGFSDIQDVLEG
ncbi:MAG: Trk system potassium transporter TrkA [Lachnospiraceae bacterium]|nr:Trk system potassium transporter TrkA [Lachnospiraceae bacterium]